MLDGATPQPLVWLALALAGAGLWAAAAAHLAIKRAIGVALAHLAAALAAAAGGPAGGDLAVIIVVAGAAHVLVAAALSVRLAERYATTQSDAIDAEDLSLEEPSAPTGSGEDAPR